MNTKLNHFLSLPLRYHLALGFFIRMVFILYGDYHDRTFDVPYTDIDYKVFTDAARHVINGKSPYKRHTYRYSPVIAYMVTPNLYLCQNFGKILFSAFDILVTIAIKKLVEQQLISKGELACQIARYCSLFWIYNPMSIAISTRGNADSLTSFFVILSLFFLQTNFITNKSKYVLSGALLGVSIHLRLYPLAFSYPMYLSLNNTKITRGTKISDAFLAILPNTKQMILAISCIATLIGLTFSMYVLYGYEFLFETYIYHLFRKDTKHNFAVLFYHSYLGMGSDSVDIVRSVNHVCEFAVLFGISLIFGTPKTLAFALFCQAVVLVAFNTVMTSQYFIWFLSLLPLVVHNFKIPMRVGLFLCAVWTMAQAAWLVFAYLLEFMNIEVFINIWVQSILLFSAHIYILGVMITTYVPEYGFGLRKKE